MSVAPSIAEARLTGTLPVRPFGDRFYGTFFADNQKARVAAVVRHPQHGAVLLSAVAPETTNSAVFATFHEYRGLVFQAASDVVWEAADDQGVDLLYRLPGVNYRKFSTGLSGVIDRHYATLPLTANILDMMLHPVEIPEELEKEAKAALQRDQEGKEKEQEDSLPAPLVAEIPHPQESASGKSRFILGNFDEETPNAQSAMGIFRALRIAMIKAWSAPLWALGLDYGLIRCLPALGVRAWEIESDPLLWGQLVCVGVRDGVLKWGLAEEKQRDDQMEQLEEALSLSLT